MIHVKVCRIISPTAAIRAMLEGLAHGPESCASAGEKSKANVNGKKCLHTLWGI
jgi:hypothetical protein